jgi:Protein of unknown function (DUF2878)
MTLKQTAWIDKHRIVINIVGFQLLWWWCVLCGRQGAEILAISVVIVALIAHLKWIETWSDAFPIITVALFGCLFDQAMYRLHHITFMSHDGGSQWIPLWMVGLWLAFACTLNVSMRWLQGRWWLALLLGTISGPLAYLGAEKLEAIVLLQGKTTLLYLAIGWGLLFPWLLRMRQHWNNTGSNE